LKRNKKKKKIIKNLEYYVTLI